MKILFTVTMSEASYSIKFLTICFSWILFISKPNLVYAEKPASNKTFNGVASCASSNCHGSMSPRNSTSVLQNEYITWLKKDRHAEAWKTLLTPESKRIAWQLGITDPSVDETCTQCHTSKLPVGAQAGAKFRHEDGVGCESCHGASGDWLSSHAANKTSHQENVDQGLNALEDPNIRAQTCLSCHGGDPQRPFTHRIYSAGHPRLHFELDTFTAFEPAHWLEDDDYRLRKGGSAPLEYWFAGQIRSAQLQLETFRSLFSHKKSLFPEYNSFHCYSCHHSLESNQYLEYDYRHSLGFPNLNLSAFEMVAVALQVINSKDGELLMQALSEVSANISHSEINSQFETISLILARNQGRSLEFTKIDSAKSLKEKLLSYCASQHSLYYQSAEQLAMALQSSEYAGDAKTTIPPTLKKIFANLSAPESYKPLLLKELCSDYEEHSVKK